MTIEKTHHLSSLEMKLLKSLIGKTLISIDAPRHLYKLDGLLFNGVEEIYLSFKEVSGYIKLAAEFSETNFGDDFITFQITKVQSIEKVEQIGERLPALSYPISQDFIINKIEVYGESYQVYSKNNQESPLWDVEIKHPHQPIDENIENENIFLFYASNQQLLIRAFNAFEIVEFTFSNELIQSSLSEQNLEGDTIIKLKQTIS